MSVLQVEKALFCEILFSYICVFLYVPGYDKKKYTSYCSSLSEKFSKPCIRALGEKSIISTVNLIEIVNL